MGYDMYIVQEADQAEKDALAAARAHYDSLPAPWDLPAGESEKRDAAKKACEDALRAIGATERSYFRLNIFGMGRCCTVMDALGMLTSEESPGFPSPEDHGLSDWPDSDADDLSDAEEAFVTACNAVTDYEPQPVKGIPVGKFGTNDGWLVTEAQCAAAVATYRAQPEAVRAAAETEYVWWARWIAFLDYAASRGGFRVH